MNIQALDKGSHIPLYLQLLGHLVRQVETGELKPGDKIPSERELAETLEVSRITARQAIKAMLERGLIYREQGRGTFVAEPKLRGLRGFSSFTEDMKQRGMKPSSRIIIEEVVTVDDALQQTLRLAPHEQYIHLMRLRLADGLPMALQNSYIPCRIAPGLEKLDIANKSLFEVLKNQYFIHPAWTEAEVQALPSTLEEQHWLGLKPNEPVLVVRGLTFTDSFEIVESVRTAYPGNGMALYIGRQRMSADLR